MTVPDAAAQGAWPTTVTADGVARIREARAKAVRWITDRVADDGRPEGADIGNAWWRVPWALCVGGAPDVAAAVLGWAEREALTDHGDLRPGPYGGDGPGTPVYQLSPIALAAWMLARYDTARVVNDCLATFQDAASGGVYEYRDFAGDPLQDLMKTGQLGISALVTGRRDSADGVYRWLSRLYAAQPDLPARLYPSWRGDALVTDVSPGMETFLRVVDFQAARQAYFHPGLAAAFLAGYAQQTDDPTPQRLGLHFLALNQNGANVQFDDIESVQICKFGWGVAAMHTAAPDSGQLPWVVRMGEWFARRQGHDGSWAPSSFMTREPSVLDLLWKTAEHLMELSYIEHALAGSESVAGIYGRGG